MPKVECWFKQDLKKPVKVQTLNGNVFTLDNVGSLIGVEVYDNGSPATLSGSVNGYIILPDDTTVSVAGTRSGNKVSINLPQSALAIPGFIKIAVKLTNSSEITTLLAVVATVYKSRTDTIITPSQQIITDWSQQIAAEMQAVEDASAAQDAKIDDLKSALYQMIPDTSLLDGVDVPDGYNLITPSIQYEIGTIWYVNNDTLVKAKNYNDYKSFIIPVTAGETYYIGPTSSTSMRWYVVTDDSGTVKGYSNNAVTGSIKIPTGGTTLYGSIGKNTTFTIAKGSRATYTDNAYRLGNKISFGNLAQETGAGTVVPMSQKAATDAINVVGNKVEIISDRVGELEKMCFVSPNIYDSSTDTDKALLIANTGAVATGYNDYFTTDYIPVSVGDVLHYQFDYNGVRRDSASYPGYSQMSRVCAYDVAKTFVSGSGASGASTYTVPDGASYVRISFNKGAPLNRAIIKATTNTVLPYFPANEIVYIKKKYYLPKTNQYFNYKGSYSESITFTDLKSSVKGITLSAVIDFSSLPTFQMGVKNESNTLYYISVDSTKLYVYDRRFGSESEHKEEYTHGLTISGDLSITAEMDNKGSVMVTICSDGMNYSIPSRLSITRAGLGYPFFTISSGAVTYISFTASVKEINMPVWLIGDSYFSDSSERWAYYLNRSESNNYLIDAYPGEGSLDAVASLENLLKIGKPSYVVWCIGMNDGSDSGAPTSRWKDNFDYVRFLCGRYDVEMIAATIPTVPGINHEYKNVYVRESGLKYIDFAKAVGANSSGVWFDGMLSSDNVHPTAKGAKALFYTAITDFQQLLVKH